MFGRTWQKCFQTVHVMIVHTILSVTGKRVKCHAAAMCWKAFEKSVLQAWGIHTSYANNEFLMLWTDKSVYILAILQGKHAWAIRLAVRHASRSYAVQVRDTEFDCETSNHSTVCATSSRGMLIQWISTPSHSNSWAGYFIWMKKLEASVFQVNFVR